MNNLKPKSPHYSLADWEFEEGHGYFISAVQSVSPPSSIAAPENIPRYPYCYLKETLAKCVPQGKFITWFRFSPYSGYLYIFFRQQTPLVHSGNQNGYRLEIDRTGAFTRLLRFIDGGGLMVGSYTHDPIPGDIWLHIKVKFWEYIPPSLVPTLRIELFFEEAGEWVSKGYLEDGDNPFADSDINRIGWAMNSYHNTYIDYLDDTEIWKKT